MSRRLRGAEVLITVVLGAAIAVGLPDYGLLCALPLAAGGLGFWLAQSRLAYVRRPEYLLFGAFLFSQAMFTLAVITAQADQAYLLALLILPMLLGGVVFPPMAAGFGLVVTLGLMALAALVAIPDELGHAPFALLYPMAIAVSASIPAAAVRDLDLVTRQTAVVDRLTGLLNRAALEARVAEVVHQSQLADHRLALVLGDVDHFKDINDTHGHATGDKVLAEVARRLSAAMGTEPVYRLGGEEFLVLMADSDTTDAAAAAERMRSAIESQSIGGLTVTMSFGVACSPAGEQVDYERTLSVTDEALYAAKRGGRNRVVAGDCATEPAAAPNVVAFDRRRAPAGEGAGAPAGQPARALHAVPDDRNRFANERKESGSWLVRDKVQRDHLLDANLRVHQTNRPAYVVAFAAVLAGASYYGWLTLIAFAPAIVYNVVEHLLDRFKRPEYALGGMWLFAQTGNAAGISVMHFAMPHVPLYGLPFMMIMMTGSCAAYPRRGVAVGISFAVFATLVSAFLIDSSLAWHSPGIVTLNMGLVASAGFIGAAVGRSSVDHRNAAVVDQLTGMLNRGALEARVAELAHHASAVGQQVAVIVGDLDHFKQVNDTHGHNTGDAVLQEAAYRIRKRLRAFESAYRVGGEEFVVLLPGVSRVEATEIAQRICTSLRDEPIAGVHVTMSLGVAASDEGQAFDYTDVFQAADAALYEAKQTGRDCVRCDDGAAALAA